MAPGLFQWIGFPEHSARPDETCKEAEKDSLERCLERLARLCAAV